LQEEDAIMKETMKTHNIGFDTSSSSTYSTNLVLFVMAFQPNHEWILDSRASLLELLHAHLGFILHKVFICLLVIISHYPISYILGENIPPGEYSLSVHTSV
jgi:hypothetical protein